MKNTKFYTIGISVIVGLSVLVIICFVLGRKSDKKISEKEQEIPKTVSSLNVIEDTIEEIPTLSSENKENNVKSTTQDLSTSNKNTVYMQKLEEEDDEVEEDDDEIITNGEALDPTFKYPVEGDIYREYAKDKLVYSDTLGEWVTHLGVDIKAKKTSVVKASAPGCVKSIKNDPRYGLTVVIEHNNGYSSIYSNLLTAEFIKVGENVSEGQTIGTVGNTAPFEIVDEPHLHFEITKDGEQIDPTMYLKN